MKKASQSKTFWLGMASFVTGLIGYSIGHEFIADNTQLVSILVAVNGAIGIVMRFLTTEPIKMG